MKIYKMIFAAIILMAIAGPARGASREWVGITDLAGDRLDVTASGTLPISSAITFSTGTIGVSGTVTASDGGGSLTVDSTNFDIRQLTSADVVTATGTVAVTGTVTMSNTSIQITDGSEIALINATGALYVEPVQSGTWTAKNYDVATASASGSNLDPDAPASVFMLVNESTSPVYVNIGGVAADKTGIYVGPKGSVSCDSATILTLSVYNTSASAVAPISILYADKRP